MNDWEVLLCMNNLRVFLFFLLFNASALVLFVQSVFNPERLFSPPHLDDTSALPAAESLASEGHLKSPSK